MTRPRNLVNRASDSVSVKDYGAVGDGTTDDTTAIQAALTATVGTGRVVYVPKGNYVITRPLRLFNGQSIVGESSSASVITKTTTTADTYGSVAARSGAVSDSYNVDSVISVIAAANDYSRYNKIQNLSLVRSSGAATSYGIYCPRIAYGNFDNLYIEKATHGIYSFVLFLMDVSDVTVAFCYSSFSLVNDGTSLGGSTSLRLVRFYSNQNSAVVDPYYGIYLYGLNYASLITCAADGNAPAGTTTGGGAYWMANCQGITLVSCGAENTKGCVIRATSCDSLTVVGLHAKPITGAAYGGTQAVRWIDGTKATFIGCDYDAVTSAGTLYNLVLQGGSHLTDINEGTAVSGGNGFVGYGGSSTWTKWASGALQIAGATPSVPASHVGLGATTSTTVGAAGGASALPATPSGYLTVNIGGTAYKVPYFAS